MINFIILFGFVLALYTQFSELTAVPGLHFDEAWQGVYAFRILNEVQFWPTEAMNSYTSPILHYILAGLFSFTGPTLGAMRAGFAIMNLTSLGLLCWAVSRFTKVKWTLAWLIFFWALLPICVTNHRFYVEVTAFHTLCFSVLIASLSLWKSRPNVSSILVYLSIVLGTYSHILFVTTFLSGLIVLPIFFKEEVQKRRALVLTFGIAFTLAPLAFRMGLGVKKYSPFLLGFFLIFVGLLSLLGIFREQLKINAFFHKFWAKLIWINKNITIAGAVLAFPFLLLFIAFFWNGFWPYAQVTGKLNLVWIPINLALLLFALFSPKDRNASIFFRAFFCTFFLTQCLILKPTSRYYTVPLLSVLLGTSLVLGPYTVKYLNSLDRIKKFGFSSVIFTFIAWNLFSFHKDYIIPFQTFGTSNKEFGFSFFHDSARDFRPFQKAFAWLVEKNCQDTLTWVEDDRFLYPVKFLRYTAPPEKGPPAPQCPWESNNLFFSHIPNYQRTDEKRTPANTPPPFENVKFLAHFREWGDLAFWIRK